MRIKKLVFSLLGLALVGSVALADGLDGQYEVVAPLVAPPAHSLDKVIIHEVFYFGCPHCFELNKVLPTFAKTYGKRVELISVPIGWSGPDPGRLLMIARQKGHDKEMEVKNMILSFTHEKGLGKAMFTRDKLQFVAKLTGLSREFETLMDDPVIVKQMDDAMAFAKEKGVESTPTLILQGSVKVVGNDLVNLKKVLNSMLKEPVP
ncbi:MAG: hypothetical protein A2508_07770 [Candidatus Lambdaproteobacteria bacterium RIFOXYD12_FULL_49_8]|uniref:Thioredoxin-like fold domain-containing protein n=1 Tax=Candidatus Lambdaproteobacteria bacterium RIFOXYD2_FULL_50_16 TaxID=1817772 RepID=A0A1F6GAH3_9PROT|nr:MAG: hypothetical protein A2527_08060 [Candidatus Lambdaproteobacteria bacterium RIFOXYD2_FULL_50_16]OGG97715.1 MAG: hypothetical protein A2508_07770 [Candidatus Lambdaproteobacteria bacterium RIFOXYD12_FULL_49_8]